MFQVELLRRSLLRGRVQLKSPIAQFHCAQLERCENFFRQPLPLMQQVVSDYSTPGGLVLDPFAGSGTTGVACIQFGRRFVGWEVDESHFDYAVKRLRATRQQFTIFDAKPPGKQEDMF